MRMYYHHKRMGQSIPLFTWREKLPTTRETSHHLGFVPTPWLRATLKFTYFFLENNMFFSENKVWYFECVFWRIGMFIVNGMFFG